ncbi:MAG: carboxypeptidase regulatory-like domain-containing protein [Acidobacteriota bacterium]|nr:carboxypeptidase regulatory-like domain-containing protein [Acidobacteriota bacterium]
MLRWLPLWIGLIQPVFSQSTQGVILGTVTNSVTGLPVPGSAVSCLLEATGAVTPAHVDARGNYAIASLSPGQYRITVSAAHYQQQEARALELPVAGRVELNFKLRPLSDVWEAGQYRSWLLPQSQQSIAFYGPDVDSSRVAIFSANRGVATPLENARSDVIAPAAIDTLPLVGRDVYTMLLLLPGVTSDTATARGLGFSVNGQRPSSSNYLLDGLENNNLLVTGPSTAATPEFVQEYRVSTTNYSAEYGRTSGFVANAITRSGSNNWRGGAYFYFENDRLNATGFQTNARGFARAPFTQLQPGVLASGPVIRNRLFFFAGFQATRSHGRSDPQLFALPSASFIRSTDPNSFAGRLLRTYPAEASGAGSGNFGPVLIAPVTAFHRTDSLVRLDWEASPSQQVFLRFALDSIRQPELIFNPYRDFSTPFNQNALSLAAGWISRFGASAQNEFRVARTGDSVRVETARRELPTLVDQEFIRSGSELAFVRLPGNPNQFDYRNLGRNWEFVDNWMWITGRHALKFGGGLLQRDINLRIAVYPQGYLQFASLADFVAGQPAILQAQVDRAYNSLAPVSPDRAYRYRQFYGFAQDSFHAGARLTLDYGFRYEWFGAPTNTGAAKDLLIQLGHGPDIRSSLMSATQILPSSSGDQSVYSSKSSNVAVRAGMAWDPTGTGRTLVRASYGIFYDRLFDNLWENVIQNRYQTGAWTFDNPISLPAPLAQLEAAGTSQSSSELIPGLAFQPGLRSPRTHSAYAGVQERLTPSLTLEIDGLASRARQLITTDQINRPYSVGIGPNNPFGLIQPEFQNYINYRANQGSSDYAALVSALRIRSGRFQGQVSYTWSHSIDNQSEPLAGTFFDLNAFGSAQKGSSPFLSSFTRQFASGQDRGNSDFDQRHSLVFYGTYQARPYSGRFAALARGWMISGLGALRSGLPFTVYALADASRFPPETLVNQRADLLAPAQVYISQPVNGGRRLLNFAAFANPGPNTIGSSGRNGFAGPGLFNLDASLSRAFAVPAAGESFRIVVRADFYNLLNHANLNNPASFFGSPDFGVAQYGRREANSGFPLLAPLNETARQIQLMLRLEF